MDFFAAQDNARKSTRFLVVSYLLSLAVLSLVAYLGVHYFVNGSLPQYDAEAQSLQFDPKLLLLVSAGFFLLIGGASFFHGLRLSRGGGEYIAKSMGGKLVDPVTAKGKEKQLINVVQEMAIASGTPVPPVYVIDNPSINAFAAGSTLNNAVIGVTSGSVDGFTRDELQGVIAHEFSHIVNGDMRLNIKMTGIIFGLMALGNLGLHLLFPSFGGRHRHRSDNSNPVIPIVLVVVGYIGVFIGSLLRAAISRQREYLADASSVQFTRNPEGIGAALDRIRRSSAKRLNHPKANESGHMFISAVASGFTNPFATHPPLEERIRAVLPNWDGTSPIGDSDQSQERKTPAQDRRASTADRQQQALAATAAVATGAAVIASTIGNVDDQALEQSRTTLERVQDPVAAALAEGKGKAVPYAMLLSTEDSELRQQQLAAIPDTNARAIAEKLFDASHDWMPSQRFAAVQLALPKLRELEQDEFINLTNTMASLVQADDRVTMLEWGLWGFTVHALQDNFIDANKKARPTQGDQNYVVSVLARLISAAYPQQAVAEAKKELAHLSYVDEAFEPMRMFNAVSAIALLPPRYKESFVRACIACIGDAKVGTDPVITLRSVLMMIDAPLPAHW